MRELFPALLIGTKAFEQVAGLNFQTIILENRSLREHVSTLTMARPRDLVLTDYALLSGSARSILLKFVEEYRGRIVLFSSQDLFSEVILSRFKTIVKEVEPEYIEPESDEQKVFDLPVLFPIYMSKGALSRKILKVWR